MKVTCVLSFRRFRFSGRGEILFHHAPKDFSPDESGFEMTGVCLSFRQYRPGGRGEILTTVRKGFFALLEMTAFWDVISRPGTMAVAMDYYESDMCLVISTIPL